MTEVKRRPSIDELMKSVNDYIQEFKSMDKEEAKNSNNDSNDSGATKNEATDKNTNVTEGKTVTVRSSNAANTASGSGVVSTYGKSASNAATTGDTNHNYLWLLLLIIPAAVITGALAVKRRKTRE